MSRKFSVSLPSVEDNRKIYGYKTTSQVYWQTEGGTWYYFNLNNGYTALAASCNNYKNDSKFTPIYEPFSINIGT